ncbi:hypothetical protein [Chitinophaga ginsengisegetis]|uniref:hypothetical protein n=1 Tax=Chitinophaga ginsengisegetis TaxID=393003 RepID=UPI000DBA0CAB|nr:hypothetical protein [Chitinophaga ginsengisegetis]MDR6566714.1 hypothetical protein [Chitinophaga ginsengisegetis]MDR6646444.1 hypothetical protein [Chitinophaga ginsengisegetis]MDR6652794.1 hypothetical protein [Chitinophaga ginsengisegetis]
MNLRILAAIGIIGWTVVSCAETKTPEPAAALSLTGTWKLAYSKMIENGDTTDTYPVKGQEMIKIFNGSHFAFFKHDVSKGSDSSTAVFGSGAGTYVLTGDKYEEHLQYCNARSWEDMHFTFTLSLQHDTLIQRGIEKIDSLNVNHEIIEAYIRVR